MTRRKKIDRPRRVEIQLPDSIYCRVRSELFSEIEGKVPFGALSAVAEQLFTEWLRARGVME